MRRTLCIGLLLLVARISVADELVLLGMTATWCGYCPAQQRIWRGPRLSRMAQARRIRGIRVDIDEHPDWRKHISVVPTLMLVRVDSKGVGHIVRSLPGRQSEDATAAFMQSIPVQPRRDQPKTQEIAVHRGGPL